MVGLVSAKDGSVTLSVQVPDDPGSNSGLWQSVPLQILGTTTGLLSTQVTVYIGNPYVAFVAAVVIVTFLLYLLALWIPSNASGPWGRISTLFVGADGQPSLSLFQVYVWTALTLVGMTYVFLMSGNLLNISPQVLVLLGLAGLGSIGARLVSVSTAGATPATGTGFWGMFAVGGKPDLLRLQMFVFTLTIWLYVAARVFYEQAFPELDTNVLLLMGITNGVYVGAKWAATGDPLAEVRRLRIERDELQVAAITKLMRSARAPRM
jgi:hypothetical protein